MVISHDLSETLANYDQLLLLNKKLIAFGSKEEVLTNENINQAYDRYYNPALQPLIVNHPANVNLVN